MKSPSESAHTLTVLGMDPSLSNWGFAFGRYDLQRGELQIDDLLLTQTKKGQLKSQRVNSDDLVRAKSLADTAFASAKLAQVVFVEVPQGSQSARAAASYGVAVGILASIRSQCKPFIEVTPNELKLATIGNKGASKAQIIERAITHYPSLPWPDIQSNGTRHFVASKCEHLADAIGAIEAGINTEAFSQVIEMYNATM